MTFSIKEFIGSFILVQFCIDVCNNDETANAYKMSYTLQPFIKGLFTLVIYESGVVFTALHFLGNLGMDPVS